MRKVLEIVVRHAAGKLAMPTNTQLGHLAGGRGRQSVAKALDRLEAQRKIRVDHRNHFRRIYVVCSPSITGWGEHRGGGHAPYCRNARGSVPGLDFTAPPKPIGRGEGFHLLGIAFGERYAYEQTVLSSQSCTSPARTCQYISGDVRAGSGQFCLAPSVSNSSWCKDHISVIFPGSMR